MTILFEQADKLVAILVGIEWIVEVDFWQTGQAAENKILDTRLRRGRQCHGLAIAAKAGGDPQNINLCHGVSVVH
jgi:hypothetical protein